MHLKPTAGCKISTLIFGNTFDLSPKWQRTLPCFSNFSWDMYTVPPNPNIKVDI
jgi:hypothetical protein